MTYTGRPLLPARMMLKNLHDLKHSIYLPNHGVSSILSPCWSVGRTSLPTKQKSMTGLAQTPYDISETRSTICEVTAQQSREGKSCYEDLSGYAPPHAHLSKQGGLRKGSSKKRVRILGSPVIALFLVYAGGLLLVRSPI